MEAERASSEWLSRGSRRSEALKAFSRPMTAFQLSRRSNLTASAAKAALGQLRRAGLATCLNERARSNRIYWLTSTGQRMRAELFKDDEPSINFLESSRIDWTLVGWAGFSRRAEILKVLDGPLAPPEVRRRALARSERVRMTTDKVRAVLKELASKGLVRQVRERRLKRPYYKLTPAGLTMRSLLIQMESG